MSTEYWIAAAVVYLAGMINLRLELNSISKWINSTQEANKSLNEWMKEQEKINMELLKMIQEKDRNGN